MPGWRRAKREVGRPDVWGSLSVPRTPSVACDQHFDARPRARQASGSGPLVPLPGILPRPRARPTRLPHGHRSRHRGRHAAPRGRSTATPGPSAGAGTDGSGPAGGTRTAAPPQPSRQPFRPAGGLAALAPGPRHQTLGLPAPRSRSAGHREGNRHARPPVGEGESDLGLPPHPRRARHHGHRHRPLERLGDPGHEEPTAWAASSTSTGCSPALGRWSCRHHTWC